VAALALVALQFHRWSKLSSGSVFSPEFPRPVIDRLAARANAGYVSGRYDVDGMTLYVNNGTALWPGFALRLGRPSELTRITLRQAGAT
jgi:predicted MPP superfamily phosphohydrolase